VTIKTDFQENSDALVRQAIHPNSSMIAHQRVIKIAHQRVTNNTHKKNTHTLVFDDENLRAGFAQAPNVVLRNPLLSSNSVRLYILLLSYAWDKDECYPGQKTLAEQMGCKHATITRTLAELKKHKLITWERQGLGKSNIYHIRKLSDGYLPKQLVD